MQGQTDYNVFEKKNLKSWQTKLTFYDEQQLCSLLCNMLIFCLFSLTQAFILGCGGVGVDMPRDKLWMKTVLCYRLACCLPRPQPPPPFHPLSCLIQMPVLPFNSTHWWRPLTFPCLLLFSICLEWWLLRACVLPRLLTDHERQMLTSRQFDAIVHEQTKIDREIDDQVRPQALVTWFVTWCYIRQPILLYKVQRSFWVTFKQKWINKKHSPNKQAVYLLDLFNTALIFEILI
jgi:hypothetical protein